MFAFAGRFSLASWLHDVESRAEKEKAARSKTAGVVDRGLELMLVMARLRRPVEAEV